MSDEAEKEIERLRWMMAYALDAPDGASAIKSILFDALNGCAGASNLDEIRAKFGSYVAPEREPRDIAIEVAIVTPPGVDRDTIQRDIEARLEGYHLKVEQVELTETKAA